MRVAFQIIAAFLIVARAGAAESPRKYYVNDFAKSPLLDEAELLEEEKSEDPVKVDAVVEGAPPPVTAASLAAQYGDPSADPAINVVENAPKPFKAMMAAFETGDNDLAFQYARQYVRYLNRLNQRTTKVMGATRYAMASEGLLNPEKFPDDPRYREFRKMYENDLAKEEAATSQIELPEGAKEILAKAEEAENGPSKTVGVTAAGRVATPITPATEKLPAKVPVDPQGKVDLYLFIKLRQAESQSMLSRYAEVAKKYKDDPKIKLVLQSLDPVSSTDLKRLQHAVGPHVSIRQGADELVKLLGIRGTPTLAIVSPSTSQAVIEEGNRSTEYMQSIIRMMRGGK